MGNGIESLPPAILVEILRRLGAADLCSVRRSSSTFRSPSGVEPYRFMSITDLAAHHCCQMHPLFKCVPEAQSELLVRCGGNWKLVLHFLESSQRSSGRCTDGTAHDKVLSAAGAFYTLFVNRKGELYGCGTSSTVCGTVLGRNDFSLDVKTPKLISLPSTTRRIIQISSSFEHAAFVTETGQVYTFGENRSCCCGVGESGESIVEPTLVTTLEGIPCLQVTTGGEFTLAVTRDGEVYSWGCGNDGQLGHGDKVDEFRPRKIERFDSSDPVVQVSAGNREALAVTKSGQLFTWGHDTSYDFDQSCFVTEGRPTRVEHGGFDRLFITSAAAGLGHFAAIDFFGHVYTWEASIHSIYVRHEDIAGYRHTPLLVASLKDYRAVQVVARMTTYVLLDNGRICCCEHMPPGAGNAVEKLFARNYITPYVVNGHRVRSVECGVLHALAVTEQGAIFGFGNSCSGQLGELNEAQVNTPVEVFTTEFYSEKAVEACNIGEDMSVGEASNVY